MWKEVKTLNHFAPHQTLKIKSETLPLRMEMFISGHKAEKQLQNQNHTEDWALGCHPP